MNSTPVSENRHADDTTATIAFAMAMLLATVTAYFVGNHAGLEVPTRVWIGIGVFFVYVFLFVFLFAWIRHKLIWKKIKSGNYSFEEQEKLLDVVTHGAYSRAKESPEYKAAEAKASQERKVYLDPLLEKIENRVDKGSKTLSEEDKRILDADLKELEKRLQWLNKK